MGAPFDDASVGQEDDLVDLFETAQAVRDEQRAAAFGQCKQIRGERVRRGRVQVLGRLVEHEQREVGQQRSGDRDPLALSAREPGPGWTDPRGEPVGQLGEPPAQADPAEDAFEFGVGGRTPPDAEVLGQRRVEQMGASARPARRPAARRPRPADRWARRRAARCRRRPAGSARARPPGWTCRRRSVRRGRDAVPVPGPGRRRRREATGSAASAGVRRRQSAGPEPMRARRERGRRRRVDDEGRLLHGREDPAGGDTGALERLGRGRQRGDELERRERDQGQDGEQRAVERAGVGGSDTEGQGTPAGQPGQRRRQRRGRCPRCPHSAWPPCATAASASTTKSSCCDAAPMTMSSGAPSTRSTTAALSSPRAVACRDSARAARRPVNHGTAVAARRSADQRHDAGAREDRPQDGHRGGSDERGHREGLDDPEHDVLQRVDVVDGPRHQVAPSEERHAVGRDGLEAFVNADAEVGEDAQRGVVSDQAFAVAEETARQAEELHADDGQRERRLGRVLRRPGDQPGRGAHQGDGSADGAGAERATPRPAALGRGERCRGSGRPTRRSVMPSPPMRPAVRRPGRRGRPAQAGGPR